VAGVKKVAKKGVFKLKYCNFFEEKGVGRLKLVFEVCTIFEYVKKR
jgi:hypothetical protein